MNQPIDQCEHIRLTLIANATALQHCKQTEANVIPIPGTDRHILIGNNAALTRLLELSQPANLPDPAPLALRTLGGLMSNVLYNLAQRPGDKLAACAKDLHRQWDAAVDADKQARAAAPADSDKLDNATAGLANSAIHDAPNAEQADWTECERIANIEKVDDALRGFSEDPTGDAGTMVVRAVLEALSATAAGAGSAQPLSASSVKPLCSASGEESAQPRAEGDGEKVLPEGFTLAPYPMPDEMREYLQARLHSPICKAEIVWKHLLKMGLGMEDE